jgi:endonuclease/exonuclease/phosphatase family metal-dependent hydrolase
MSLMVSLFVISGSLIIQPCTTLAQDVLNEFNQPSLDWQYSMSTSRRLQQGWTWVRHDGEGSIRNTPSRAQRGVQWTLSRTFQVNSSSYLSVKSYFKQKGYASFVIQLQDQSGQHHTIYRQTQADLSPKVRTFDLASFSHQTVHIHFILNKSPGIKANKVGLYLHHANVQTVSSKDQGVDAPESSLKVAAFNIQIFGVSKMSKPDVVQSLVAILSEFDVVLIQEIRDASGISIMDLLDLLNQNNPSPFALALSPRLGRTRSKEQYAYLYRSDLLQLTSDEVLDDPEDHFEREPYLAHFRHLQSGRTLAFLGAHLSPRTADLEMNALADQVDLTLDQLDDQEELIVFGDFNADCRYLTQTEREQDRVLNHQELHSYITDDFDTTTRSTECAYDRLLSTLEPTETQTYEGDESGISEAGVFEYDAFFGYDVELTQDISDHYPVWAEIHL